VCADTIGDVVCVVEFTEDVCFFVVTLLEMFVACLC
jgi:hypothetical protein